MSPRAYQLGRRQPQIEESRRRVLDAARAMLGEPGANFSTEAVARRAGVARATVYYQFTSRSGLLEAVCDDLAAEARVAELANAFAAPDAARAVLEFASVFGRFWALDRVAMRRLRALAALDEEVGAVIGARDQRRLTALGALFGRFNLPSNAVRSVYALTAFETFDALAGDDAIDSVTPLVADLALAAIGVAEPGGSDQRVPAEGFEPPTPALGRRRSIP